MIGHLLINPALCPDSHLREEITDIFPDFEINAIIMVPIRDINRQSIDIVNIFCTFRSKNRVNVIVVYKLFCLSAAYRDGEKVGWHRMASLFARIIAEER